MRCAANTRALVEHAAPAALLAVVKADGYGHGAEQVARAALDAGASWLGVALVEEGMTLREQGIDARDPRPVGAAAGGCRRGRRPRPHPDRVHGRWHRGPREGRRRCRERHAAAGSSEGRHGDAPRRLHRRRRSAVSSTLVASRPELELEAVCTHFAVADETDHPYTNEQIERFEALLERARRGRQPTQARARGQLGRPARTPTGALRPRARRDRALRRAARSRARRSDPAARRCSRCVPGSPT